MIDHVNLEKDLRKLTFIISMYASIYYIIPSLYANIFNTFQTRTIRSKQFLKDYTK